MNKEQRAKYHKAYYKKYYEQNKEKINKKHREDYQKNKAKWRGTRKKYQQENKEKHNQNNRKRKASDPLLAQSKVLEHNLKQRVRKKSLPCDLELFTGQYLKDWLKRQPNCDCCNVKFDIGPKLDGKAHANSPSIDRFYPKKGYVKGNVYLICIECNNLKTYASSKRLRLLVNWMKRIENKGRLMKVPDPYPYLILDGQK